MQLTTAYISSGYSCSDIFIESVSATIVLTLLPLELEYMGLSIFALTIIEVARLNLDGVS